MLPQPHLQLPHFHPERIQLGVRQALLFSLALQGFLRMVPGILHRPLSQLKVITQPIILPLMTQTIIMILRLIQLIPSLMPTQLRTRVF